MSYKIAVVGATGNVGREILNIVDERGIAVREVVPLASAKSNGKQVSFGESDVLDVQILDNFDFKGTDFVLSSAGAKISKDFAARAAKAGAIVIDNTSAFRMDPDVPLVVPEVNSEALNDIPRNIVANPNCSTIQMVVALKPLHDLAGITRLNVATYQSVSGAGKAAMDELFNQTRSVYMNDMTQPNVFAKQMAFNVIPQIDVFMDDRATKEEWKMRVETKKILDPKIKLMATCVRVPVFIGHAVAVHAEFERDIDVVKAIEAFRQAPGITVIDLEHEDLEYITPVEAQGDNDVYVSRIREDSSVENGLAFWCVSDNLRKGAALNTVQIMEELISKK